VGACGTSGAAPAAVELGSAATSPGGDGPEPRGEGGPRGADDGGAEGAGGASSDTDATGDPSAGWARYTIGKGAHDATIADGVAGNPARGLVGGVAGRDYDFAFDPSAAYTLTNPAQPNDQLDWNKLPGLSDCGRLDLSVDGAMFGWRWRVDTSPKVLEVTAYANDAKNHLTPATPMLTLDADDLASVTPLRYRLWFDGPTYGFSISGSVRGRAIDASATLPRACAATSADDLLLQWAAGYYFGGTSTAPATITARIFERPWP
jgi:hypothetical protein